MNKIDEIKKMKLTVENDFIDDEFLELLSDAVLGNLVESSNSEIFIPRGGRITVEKPFGPPNAGVGYPSGDRNFPVVKIRTSMIKDIYRDALTFPIISEHLAKETDSLKDFHESLEVNDADSAYAFYEGVPNIDISGVADSLKPYCVAMIKVAQEAGEEIIGPREICTRFMMFEFMLMWTYFHELGHVVQQHYRLHSGFSELDNDISLSEFEEFNDASDSKQVPKVPDIDAQARELMADAEALDLTLKYLFKSERFSYNNCYILLCAIGCMYQRFYNNYSENLSITEHQHPHPVVRDEATHVFFSRIIFEYMTAFQKKDKKLAIRAIGYLTVRSSTFTGLFRSHRIELRDSGELPSYMRLQGRKNVDNMNSYFSTLMPSIEMQVEKIMSWHLLSETWLLFWLQAVNDMEKSD